MPFIPTADEIRWITFFSMWDHSKGYIQWMEMTSDIPEDRRASIEEFGFKIQKAGYPKFGSDKWNHILYDTPLPEKEEDFVAIISFQDLDYMYWEHMKSDMGTDQWRVMEKLISQEAVQAVKKRFEVMNAEEDAWVLEQRIRSG